MRKIFLFAMMCGVMFLAVAQKNAPKWLEKQRKAVFTVTTYGKDNKSLQTGLGFFITDSGEALSSYTIFKGADRATVTDPDGNTYPVTYVMGADELYDVIKVKVGVSKKIPFLQVSPEPVPVGSKVYMVPYTTEKKGTFQEGQITEVSKLKDNYSYYKTSVPLESKQLLNTPVLTESGQVLGLIQDDAGGNKEISYVVSAGFVNSLEITSMSILNSTFTNIGIRKAWPSDIEQAQVTLYLLNGSQDSPTYLGTINDFIANFPDSPDGYQSRASLYAYRRAELSQSETEQKSYLDKALQDMDTAIKNSPSKANMIYNKARLVYDIAVADTTLTDKNWTIASAMNILNEAINMEDSPLFHHLEGDIFFSLGAYDQAYESYMQVNNSDMASAVTYYWAAKAKERIPGTNLTDLIALLDKAIGKTNPPTQETLGYLLERIDYKTQLALYDEVVTDYNQYYQLLGGQVAPSFYYYREQAKFRSGDFTGAFEDIQQALKGEPDNPNYMAEEASIYIRQEKYQEALASLDKALQVAPEFASCYRLKGICLVRLNKKNEACEAFAKGKEFGDPLVDRLIREHCK